MVSPVGFDSCSLGNLRDFFFQLRQKGKIINIDDRQPADMSGDDTDIEWIKLYAPIQNILNGSSPVLVFLPVNTGPFPAIDRNQAISVFQIIVYNAVNIIQNYTGPGRKQNNKAKTPTAPLLTAFQLHLILQSWYDDKIRLSGQYYIIADIKMT